MNVSPGPEAPSDANPKDSPNIAFLHLVLGGQQVLGVQDAQGLPSLQEALSHPVEE